MGEKAFLGGGKWIIQSQLLYSSFIAWVCWLLLLPELEHIALLVGINQVRE